MIFIFTLNFNKCAVLQRTNQPLFRHDDDCNSEEICQGVTCVLGCRSAQTCGANQACMDNQCSDPCSSNIACGTNALCSVENHLPVCKCPLGLSGDPTKSCTQPIVKCSASSDCAAGSTCVDGLCASTCEDSSSSCLLNEVSFYLCTMYTEQWTSL